jgi:hypothetical protein
VESFKSKVIYPNPTQNTLYLNGFHNVEYQIISILGQQLKTSKILSNLESVDTSNLAIGYYFLASPSKNIHS